MSKVLYYAEQSLEDNLRAKHMVPIHTFDAGTMMYPTTSPAHLQSAEAAGKVPPSGYWATTAEDHARLFAQEPAEPAVEIEWKYILVAGALLYYLFERR